MVFSSMAFIIVFLPALLILYFATPRKWKNARQYILLLFSLVFYGAGEPLYIFLILGCISVSWLLTGKVKERNKPALVAALLVNIIPLAVTKYAGFTIRNVNGLLGLNLGVPEIVMPIGISFYTFQVITCLVDLYRGKIERQKNPFLFALYIMFFPQLIAGPIVKYEEIEKEIEAPDVSWDNIRYGAGRFVSGLGKKVLLANQAGYIAKVILECRAESLGAGMAWLCVAAYTIQIYYDFSGYSEMAIGLGAIFGFHFPENFKDPYTSLSVTGFWRRWHMTLGRFFREYVYIPLGGNRVSRPRWILNILIVWMLTGLWHGAAWNYIIWGVYYGALIILERVTGLPEKLPKPIAWVLTMLAVMLGWSIFMCDGYSFSGMADFIRRLIPGAETVNPVSIGGLNLWAYLPFLALGVLAASPLWVMIRDKVKQTRMMQTAAAGVIGDAVMAAVFALSILFLIGSTYNPFIYFRF